MDPFDLQRFVDAQQFVIGDALTEIKSGRKRGHWMWFIFPQVQGLGRSANAERYAIRSLEEARAYLNHPLLRDRLQECVQALLDSPATDITQIFEYPDDAKLRSSLTLFAESEGAPSIYHQALYRYYPTPDPATLKFLERE